MKIYKSRMKKAQVKVKEKEVVVTLLKLLHRHPLLQVQVPLQFQRKNVMIQHLQNDKKSMNTIHFKGENSFYNISNSE
jgi:hypothetical protein